MSLDLFLDAAYKRDRETQEKRATINALRRLPMPLLMKLASGEVKLGYCDAPCDSSLKGDKQNTWLAQFEGTPLQEQAVSLEQQDIALEMQEIQQRAEDRAEREAKDSQRDPIYDQRDQLRMQKKLLELQLQQSELTASAPATVDPQKKPPVPEAGNPGAGSMGPVAPSSDGELGSVGKTASQMGEELAKIALTLPNMQQLGSMAGQAGSAIKGMAQKAAPMVQGALGKLSPEARKGLMLGAAGGAVEGGLRGAHDEQGFHPMGAITGALSGGAIGGMAGAGAGHLMGKLAPKAPSGVPAL